MLRGMARRGGWMSAWQGLDVQVVELVVTAVPQGVLVGVWSMVLWDLRGWLRVGE